DPNEMAVVFGRLAEQQHSLPSVVERFFSSHPLSDNRMRDAERRAAALSRPPNAPVATARSSTFSEVNLMFAKDSRPMRCCLALTLAVADGCGGLRPALDPKAHLRGEDTRVV